MPDVGLRLIVLALAVAAGGPLCFLLPRLLRFLGLQRANYAGEPICAGGGLLFVLAAAPCGWAEPVEETRLAVVAALGFGLLGLWDDCWGTGEFRGIRGHVRALRERRLTTGLVKAGGGLLLASLLGWRLQGAWGLVLGAPLIALSANALNLLDLRPLRALKAFWAMLLLLVWSGPLPLVVWAGLSPAYAALEARRAVMLGDTGANALGATVGLALVLMLPAWGQALAVAALVLFHVWAERHSLTAWIEARPWARALDGWGWRTEEP